MFIFWVLKFVCTFAVPDLCFLKDWISYVLVFGSTVSNLSTELSVKGGLLVYSVRSTKIFWCS